MIPPVFMFVKVKDKGRTVFILPLPFILLWPIVVVLPLLLLPVLAVVQALLFLARNPYPLCQAVVAYFRILGSLRGLQAHVTGKKDNSRVNVSII